MDANEIAAMYDNVNTAILACNTESKVIYQNEKCRQLFEAVFGKADYIGTDITTCHSEETSKKIKNYIEEYKAKTRQLDYYVMDEPTGKVTVVNVPFYDGNTFKGMVEFIFESSLG